jgi:hypothetical protein
MSLLVEPVEWEPVLLYNISRQVEHKHMIYHVYPCIYMVYTWYIHRIFLEYVDVTVYTMYHVYTWYIHSIFFEYVDVTVYTMYIHGIYMVYAVNIL